MSLAPSVTFNPDVYKNPPNLGVSYGAPTASKPFDWAGAGNAIGTLLGGVGNVIRGVRGEAPIPMAGYGLGNYLQNNDQDKFLTDLISSIITKTRAESDPILRGQTSTTTGGHVVWGEPGHEPWQRPDYDWSHGNI
jgi:hypothetical protein